VPLFLSYKEKEFKEVMDKHRCYERKCFLSQYAIKAYDKKEQVKSQERINISDNLLRIEVCYNQKQKLPDEIVTLADLKNEDGIKALYKEFEDVINKIVFRDKCNLKASNREERILFFASFHPDFLKEEQELNKDEIKTIRLKIKQLRERFLKKEFKEFLLKELKDKYITLFCS
jgi:hypothetical protein